MKDASYTTLDVQEKQQESEKSRCRKDCDGLREILFTMINLLLIFVPLGFLSHVLEWESCYVFGFNFMAIIPLAGMLGGATEALALHTGEVTGGLINATFGNAVEMIITIQAIQNGLCRIVQGSLMGSILSNLLLVLGMAIFFGGMVFAEQEFNLSTTTTNHSVLLVACIGMAMPVLFTGVPGSTHEDVLTISRFCAIIMAATYVFFLFFQLKTHKYMFEVKEAPLGPEATEAPLIPQRAKEAPILLQRVGSSSDLPSATAEEKQRGAVTEQDTKAAAIEPQEAEEDGAVDLSICSAVLLLSSTTLLIAVCSSFLVDSIQDVSKNFGLPKAFIGVILLPIVGNAAEHLTAVTAAYKGHMDLALGVAVGSSSQVALFVVPFSVIVGWMYGQPMTLDFRAFDTGVLLLSVFLVASVLQDGSANWLEGLMLIGTYLMVACICCYIPEEE